jgi:hypothetical protein
MISIINRKQKVKFSYNNSHQSYGFTLLELLLYIAMLSGIWATMINITVSNIKSSSIQELRLRAIDRWGKLSSLIESEIIESDNVTTEVEFTNPCNDNLSSNSTITPLFSLRIPYIGTNSATLKNTSIYYYQKKIGSDSEVWRCGPGYLTNGQLDYEGNLHSALLSPRTTLKVIGDGRELSYTIKMYTPKGKEINVHPDESNDLIITNRSIIHTVTP